MESGSTVMCKAVNIEGIAVKATFCSRICVGDSDDSDTEGGLGNIERVVMRPPGHSGKAKRGHLCFDASFETGNLGRVDFITENEYDLFIRPDTCNPRTRFWFHFAVENVQKNQRIIFNIVNLNRSKNLFQDGLSPVVKSSSRPRWQRLPKENVYYYNSPEHSNAFVLSFAFAFDREDGEHYSFALCYPYSYSRCMEVLHNLAKDKSDIFQLETLTKTVQDRDIPCVTITEEFVPNTEENLHEETSSSVVPKMESTPTNTTSNEETGRGAEFKRIVVIMGRSHPGDSPVSLVIQGLLNFLVSDHQIAKELRQKIIFKILPMMNPDGVYLGNSRCNLLGADLNRSWTLSSKHIPGINATKSLIMDFYKTGRLDFVLDLHASSNLMGCFIQGNSYDSVYRFERHIVFAKMFSQNCPDFIIQNTFYNADPEKEGTARRYLCKEIGETTNIYSVEFSMFGIVETSNLLETSIKSYKEEDYLMHGRRLARALWDNFKVNGIIQSSWNPYGVTKSLTDFQDLQTGFSMLRLQELSKQREMYSSLESFSSDSSRDREGSSGVESSGSDNGGSDSSSDDESLTHDDVEDTEKKSKRKRKRRKDKREFNYDEFVEFTKMSFRRKVLENESTDNGIKVIGHNIFPSSRLPTHEDNFILPTCIVSLNENPPQAPSPTDPVDRLLSIERLRLRTSSMESPPLESLRSSPIVIGGGGVISSRWKKGEKCYGNKFRTDINLLNEESVVRIGLKENPKRKKKRKSSKS